MKKLLLATALLFIGAAARAEIAPVKGSTGTFAEVVISSAANANTTGKAKFIFDVNGGNIFCRYTNGNSTTTLFSLNGSSWTYYVPANQLSVSSGVATNFTVTYSTVVNGDVQNQTVVQSTITRLTAGTFVTATATGTSMTYSTGTVGAFTANSATVTIALISSMTATTLYTANGSSAVTAGRVYIGTFTTNGSTGNQAITGVGFSPRLVTFQALVSAGNTAYNAIGAMDSSGRQWNVSTVASTGGDGTAHNSAASGVACIVIGGSTPIYSAKFASMDSNGFTINATVSATQIIGFIAWE